jgi:hypothetical protein
MRWAEPSGLDAGKIAGAVPISISAAISGVFASPCLILCGKISVIWVNFLQVRNIREVEI